MIDWNIALSHFWQTVGLIVGSTFVIQISPIKLNPWGWVLKQIGKIINEDLSNKIDEMSKKIDEVDGKVDALEAEMDEKDTIQSRRRILRFADECRRESKHSQEHFTEIIEGDIKQYTNYCNTHADFENDKCVMSIAFIEKAYNKCLENNDFL